jgi:pimeloyl-ACP methyl ester carboxylesterase
LALDYRGHGQSQYDRNPKNYAIRVALADLSAVLAAFEITSAIFVGTSFGGVLAMMLAVLPPLQSPVSSSTTSAPSSSRGAWCGSSSMWESFPSRAP